MQHNHTSTIHLTQSGNLPLLEISNRHARATIALQGAQVLQYQRTDSKPLIWLSDRVEYKRGQSLRGGIPVCWPWFGDLAHNPATIQHRYASQSAPAHGLVRSDNWLIEAIDERDDSTSIALRHPGHAALSGIELRLTITIGDTLRLALHTVNNSHAPFAFSQALHTYFAIGDIHQAEVRGFADHRYIETLENWSEKTQQDAIGFDGETDRIYLGAPEQITIVDPLWQREIQLRSSTSKSAVVWNPWIEKSKRLSQFAPDAWQQMLCIETANVLGDCIELAPAQEWTLGVTLSETALS